MAITRLLVQVFGVVAMFDSDTGKSQERPKGKSSRLDHTQVSALLSSGSRVSLFGCRCAESPAD